MSILFEDLRFPILGFFVAISMYILCGMVFDALCCLGILVVGVGGYEIIIWNRRFSILHHTLHKDIRISGFRCHISCK